MASESEKKRRKLWKDKDMVAALDSVTKRTLTVSQAASTYHVPRKTLDDRVKGQVVHGTKPRRGTVLTDKERKPCVATLSIWPKGDFPSPAGR